MVRGLVTLAEGNGGEERGGGEGGGHEMVGGCERLLTRKSLDILSRKVDLSKPQKRPTQAANVRV